jgi:hypothetical protein
MTSVLIGVYKIKNKVSIRIGRRWFAPNSGTKHWGSVNGNKRIPNMLIMASYNFDAFTYYSSPLTFVCINESSSPGEFHPQALPEPDVNLSIHPALIVQPH